MRIIALSTQSNIFDLVMDKVKDDHQIVESKEGIDILLKGPNVVSTLEGKVIDYRDNSELSPFVVTNRLSEK